MRGSNDWQIVHARELMVAAARRLPELIGHDIPSQIVKAGLGLDRSSQSTAIQ